MDLREGVLVGIDHIVEEVRREVHCLTESIPIDPLSRRGIGREVGEDEVPNIDRAEVADVVGEEGLLTTGVRRLVAPELRDGVVLVRTVDEEDPWLTGTPGALDDHIEDLTCIFLADDLTGPGVEEIIGSALLDRSHELISDGDRDIEVGDLGDIGLAGDELTDIGVIDTEDPHIRAPTGPTLLDDLGRGIVEAHEGDWTTRYTRGRADEVAGGTEAAEGKARPTPRLMDEGHRAEGIIDPSAPIREGILDR